MIGMEMNLLKTFATDAIKIHISKIMFKKFRNKKKKKINTDKNN